MELNFIFFIIFCEGSTLKISCKIWGLVLTDVHLNLQYSSRCHSAISYQFARISDKSTYSFFRNWKLHKVTTHKTPIFINFLNMQFAHPLPSFFLSPHTRVRILSCYNLMCNILTALYYPRLKVNEYFSKRKKRRSGWSSRWRVSDIIRCAVRPTRGPTSRAATSCLNRQKPASFALQTNDSDRQSHLLVLTKLQTHSGKLLRQTLGNLPAFIFSVQGPAFSNMVTKSI
jgi:hypothetical protein